MFCFSFVFVQRSSFASESRTFKREKLEKTKKTRNKSSHFCVERYKPDVCERKSKSGDKLKMHYTGTVFLFGFFFFFFFFLFCFCFVFCVSVFSLLFSFWPTEASSTALSIAVILSNSLWEEDKLRTKTKRNLCF